MRLDDVLAGYVPGPRGRDGLALAVLLAEQAHARLTVATVQPPARSTPGPARAEESAWRAYLREQADATLAQARELVTELRGGLEGGLGGGPSGGPEGEPGGGPGGEPEGAPDSRPGDGPSDGPGGDPRDRPGSDPGGDPRGGPGTNPGGRLEGAPRGGPGGQPGGGLKGGPGGEPGGGGAEYVAHTHRGSGRGLVELARRRGADVVVIGSASGSGRGRISVGSTADQLLHSSSVPVLLAPRGYGDQPPAAFDRLTVAYRRGPGCDAAVKDAAGTAAALGVPLRLVTLVISSGRRARIEEEMLVRLRDQAAADLHAAARGRPTGRAVEVEVLEGRNVAQALGTTSWLPGEMIICASSDTGPLRRVFLGDTSMKIVRASTCPVMILTREP
ncbi:hypothetical protein GCM10009850_026750 [Nonomuraea monospora]|uniref:UspA domain-containing protein n=1 Tax=Nonomuraea monospora TaxID=568818 RepID=A0ABP5P636_9ACTN